MEGWNTTLLHVAVRLQQHVAHQAYLMVPSWKFATASAAASEVSNVTRHIDPTKAMEARGPQEQRLTRMATRYVFGLVQCFRFLIHIPRKPVTKGIYRAHADTVLTRKSAIAQETILEQHLSQVGVIAVGYNDTSQSLHRNGRRNGSQFFLFDSKERKYSIQDKTSCFDRVRMAESVVFLPIAKVGLSLCRYATEHAPSNGKTSALDFSVLMLFFDLQHCDGEVTW